MKNIIVCILFVGIVIALVEVSIDYIILKKGKKYLQQRVELLEQENYLLRDGFFCSYIYDSEQMFNFDLLVNDINGDKRQITSFVKNKSILVYLTNYESCPDCFSLPIQNLKKSGIDFIIGIGGMSEEKFRVFAKSNGIESCTFLLPDGFFNGFHINPSLYFVLDNSGRYSKIFTPSDKLPYLTTNYLKFIKTGQVQD